MKAIRSVMHNFWCLISLMLPSGAHESNCLLQSGTLIGRPGVPQCSQSVAPALEFNIMSSVLPIIACQSITRRRAEKCMPRFRDHKHTNTTTA
jgi:hypothetical protein